MKFEDGYMKVEIGDFVYKAYQPQTPGKVVRVIEGEERFNSTGKTWKISDRAEIKWIDGTTSIVDMLSLNDFRRLIADHEKKLSTHRLKLTKLEQL
jgi:hypothetical protein